MSVLIYTVIVEKLFFRRRGRNIHCSGTYYEWCSPRDYIIRLSAMYIVSRVTTLYLIQNILFHIQR